MCKYPFTTLAIAVPEAWFVLVLPFAGVVLVGAGAVAATRQPALPGAATG